MSYINVSTRIAIQLDSPKTKLWGRDEWNTPLPDCKSFDDALNDFNGKSYTQAWVYYQGNANTSHAPGYCYSYTTTGTSEGDWYLPAAGELHASIWTNKSSVNAGLSKAGGTAIVENWHWSSSEVGKQLVWIVHASDGRLGGHSKDVSDHVRCVLAF